MAFKVKLGLALWLGYFLKLNRGSIDTQAAVKEWKVSVSAQQPFYPAHFFSRSLAPCHSITVSMEPMQCKGQRAPA